MSDEQIWVLVRPVAFALVAWKLWRWFRAFKTSRELRRFYEQQTPEKKKEIEESWKDEPLAAAYTKPMPTYLLIWSVVLGVSGAAALIYLKYKYR